MRSRPESSKKLPGCSGSAKISLRSLLASSSRVPGADLRVGVHNGDYTATIVTRAQRQFAICIRRTGSWAGIALRSWFAEREYGGVELRFVTWNMAVGLSSIYFLNGCAIFLYGLQVLAPGLFLIAMFVLMMVMTGLYPLLSVVGLFDTWANFRMRMDRLAEAIRNAQSGES